jgi:hypothetical protein
VCDPGNQYWWLAKVAEVRGDRAIPLAMAGRTDDWELLRTEQFQKVIGADIGEKGFLWVDANGDGAPQPEEVQIGPKLQCAYFTSFIGDDLTLNYQEIQIPANGFNACGAPNYSFQNARTRKPLPVSATYSTALLPDGSTFGVTSPLCLVSADGKLRWTYPENYLGVHASHRAPRPKQGECSGSLLYIGCAKADGDIGTLIGVVSNFGYYTLFTEDGMHAARLFHDHRTGAPGWYSTEAPVGMEVGGFTLGGEHFFGSFTRATDGKYYVVAGHNHSSIVEVQGLESLTRGGRTLEFTARHMAACEDYVRRQCLTEARAAPPRFLRVPRIEKFKADGDLGEWAAAQPADIRGAGTARLAYNAENLLLAFQAKDSTPLLNTGGEPKMLFKTGDSVDLQIAADPKADPKRMEPAAGDVRLLITEVQGKIVGVLYRYRVPGTPDGAAEFFNSPWRSARVDRIETLKDLPAAAQKSQSGYTLEIAVPLKALGLEPKPGMRLPADFGILLGDEKGQETRERLYWANPATALITDIPSEIELRPAMWGTVEFGE